jgi:hypothetical protein
MTDADGASEHDQAKRLRIVLADDHEVMRYGLQLVLDGKPEFEAVAQAG